MCHAFHLIKQKSKPMSGNCINAQKCTERMLSFVKSSYFNITMIENGFSVGSMNIARSIICYAGALQQA